MKKLCYLLLLPLVFQACKTSHTVSKEKYEGVVLDTIDVVFNKTYRASATRSFDLTHTKLEVRFDYTKRYLSGSATLTLRPYFYTTDTLTLDAKGMDIRMVALDQGGGQMLPLKFTYDSMQLHIALNRPYHRNEWFKVFVEYTAKPDERRTGGSAAISSDKGLYFINPDGSDSSKPVQIWTQGETEANSCWFPTIDKPNERCTQEIYITRDKKYVSLSNGLLMQTFDNGDGTETDYWFMDQPHAPYLFMMAVGDFAIVKDQWRGREVSYYVEREYENVARKIFGNTPEMLDCFSNKFGVEYPWKKYAQVVVRDYVSGAMENTSASLFGEFMQRNSRQLLDEDHEDIIAHELMHQWFGDLVTCESWSNLTLNEGFATYGEYIWNEHKYGKEFADYQNRNYLEGYLREAEQKNVDLIRFYYNDKEDMFDNHSYDKGGWVLHMLRAVLGDEAFFEGIKTYLQRHQFGSVEVHDLRLAMEAVSGQDLNWFFNQWFLNSGHPKLNITYSHKNDSVYVAVSQTQNTARGLVYRLPMSIAIYRNNQPELHEVELEKKEQVFAFHSPQAPEWTDADAHRTLLCERSENKTLAQYILQAKQAGNYIARAEALDELEQHADNPDVKNALSALITDPFFAIRSRAIGLLKYHRDSVPPAVANEMLLLASRDAQPSVRGAAVEKIGNWKLKDGEAVVRKALGDSSYTVAGKALVALMKYNPADALALAQQWQNENISELAGAVAEVYVRDGSPKHLSWFEQRLDAAKGGAQIGALYSYANFLTKMEKPVVLSGIENIRNRALSYKGGVFSHYAAGPLKRIGSAFKNKSDNLLRTMKAEKDKTKLEALQDKLAAYTEIINAANEAVMAVDKNDDHEQ